MNAQAIVAVTAMMTSFGHPTDGEQAALADRVPTATSEVVCVAAHVWQQARTASFERKLSVAAEGVAAGDCFIGHADLGDDRFAIEFSHRRDAEAWDDAVLATLTAMQAAGYVAGSGTGSLTRAVVEVDGDTARAKVIAVGNILDFWQNTPIKGIDIEPGLDMLQRASTLDD